MEAIRVTSLMDLSHFLYFLLLVGAMASFWGGKKKFTVILGLAAGGVGVWLSHIHLLGVFSLGVMGSLLLIYNKSQNSFWVKWELFAAIAFLGILFYEHMIAGFQNFIVAKNVFLSSDSKPYQFYLNADKVFVGFMLLMAVPALNKNFKDWKETVRVLPLPFLGVSIVLLGTAFMAHYIRVDIKAPGILWWWIPANLFLVCASEEIFFRGFLQTQLAKFFQSFSWGKEVALLIAALLFGLNHHAGGAVYVFLSTLAGIGYGYVYLRSQRIESSILLHFSVNLIHILVFSYPALIK